MFFSHGILAYKFSHAVKSYVFALHTVMCVCVIGRVANVWSEIVNIVTSVHAFTCM